MGIKISQLTAKGSSLQSTDLLEIAQSSGISYDSKSITGQEIIDAIDTVYTSDGMLAGHRQIDGNNKDLELANLNTFSVNALGLGAGTPDDMILMNINAANVSASGRIFNVVDGNASVSRLAVLKNGDLQINGTISTQSNANIQLTPNGTGAVIINIPFNTQTVSYTLALTDNCKLVEINNAGAVNLTIPPNSSVAFPIGAQILISQYGAGQVTIVPGAGVTLRSSGGKTKTAAQYSVATLIKRATNEWYLSGDITT